MNKLTCKGCGRGFQSQLNRESHFFCYRRESAPTNQKQARTAQVAQDSLFSPRPQQARARGSIPMLRYSSDNESPLSRSSSSSSSVGAELAIKAPMLPEDVEDVSSSPPLNFTNPFREHEERLNLPNQIESSSIESSPDRLESMPPLRLPAARVRFQYNRQGVLITPMEPLPMTVAQTAETESKAPPNTPVNQSR